MHWLSCNQLMSDTKLTIGGGICRGIGVICMVCEGELNGKQIVVKKLRPLPLVLEGHEEVQDSFFILS